MAKKRKNDPNQFRNEKNNILEFIVDNKKLVMPLVLVVAVIITIGIALSANKKVTEETQSVQDLSAAAASSAYEVPESDLELNAYADVNELITKYYQADAEGDVDTIASIYQGLDETTKLKIQEVSAYIEGYTTVDVYTKPGPVDGSYVVYAYTEVKLKDYENAIPGMETMYVCTDENGSLYINGDVVEDNVMEYIMAISLQDDVVDLNNKVAAEYNDMISNDADLAALLSELKSSVEVSVGETLAAGTDTSEESSETADSSEDASDESSEDETSEAAQETTEEIQTVTTRTLKAIEVVNIRSSDSTTADILGKTSIDEQFIELESLANGWSRIEYNGGEAYVKTEFFEVVGETTTEVAAEETEEEEAATENTETEETTETESTSTTTVSSKTGKMQVSETVRLRKSESTEAEILATIYKGSFVNVVEQYANGWAKVEYNSKTGYIKCEFLIQ
ncbi:MAG: SH3 domain-containing protein [Butyrivibrio sp.]|nr:SH3 domain-containing protein [Butyrivibrio sp.]